MSAIIKKPLGVFIVLFDILVFFSIIDFSLFHFIIDFFAIFVGFMIFIISINSRAYTEKLIYLVLSVSYLYISSLDLMHLITFYGVSELGQSLNQSYQYFTSARMFEAFILVVIFTLIKNPHKVNYIWLHAIGISIFLGTVIVVQYELIPTYFVEGVGQTSTKMFVSYITAILFIVGAYFAYHSNLPTKQKNIFVIVLFMKAISQIIYIHFVNVGDAYQTIAVWLRFASYGGLYIVFVQEIISSPYQNVYKLFETKEKELLTLSQRDGLTGIYNHSLTFKNIEKLILEIGNKYSNLCVVLFDIDNFKQINDSYGHIKGDEMLKLFSNSLLDLNFKDQMTGRYGGDEFVLAIPDCFESSVEKLFVKLNERLKILTKEHGVQVTFSAGVVLWNIGDNATDLIRKADIKMYESKDKGKNQFTVWNQNL